LEVLLAFLTFTFVTGVRGKGDASAPRRGLVFVMSVLLAVALLSHRFA
jgi:hypothetical protein